MPCSSVFRRVSLLVIAVISISTADGRAGVASAATASDLPTIAAKILEETGVRGGFVVHLGCGDGQLTAALRTNTSFQVHGLDPDETNVATARQHVKSLEMYGDVSIDRLPGDQLPYVDDLVNLLVAEDRGAVPMREVLRVLAPGGVAYVKQGDAWSKTVKPRPENIDRWTHFMHDATGNAVAHDSVVGPPRHLQWIGSPRWSRHHDRMASLSAMVSSGQRVFYIMDEGSRVSIQLPPKWTLIARDAFNGTVLWKRPIAHWHSHLWPLKSGPTQLARRLVVQDDRVYVTLGLEAPLAALDAATGETVHEYEQTDSTEEVIASGDLLFLQVNKQESELASYAPKFNVGDQKRVGTEFGWNDKPRTIMAVAADGGRTVWSHVTPISPLTLAADQQHVFFHDGEKVVCLDRATGQPLWNSPPVARRGKLPFNFGPKLVIYDDVVLFAGGDRTMKAFSVKTGEQLWSAPHAQSGYQSPEDLLVSGGLVWSGPTTRTADTGEYTGRDPLTGEVKKQFPPDVDTYWFHHRCHMAKATDRYLLPSRTGIEFVDHEQQHWDINHWVRGGCLYGIMPCNGMVYAPPHNCACYPETKLYGLNALAAASASRQLPEEISDEGRLLRGPAYGQPVEPSSKSHTSDWPTYRHDAQRSGYSTDSVADDLTTRWQAKLGGRLSSVVVAEGMLLVAKVDQHTVCALDADSGETRWSYTAGGRVDSPPTIDQGRVLFGSADGHVYCLRVDNGQLIWRFRGAPVDRRLMAFEQLESAWPIHGSVLVRDGHAYFVAGRSNFLDGGLRFFRLDTASGRKLAEVVLDEKDPESGQNLQDRIKILNMPVGLPDVLSSDDRYVYMRSQRFDLDGQRHQLGPHSGQPAEQAAVQRGDRPHLFAPMGLLDDTWFHRSYWVFGRSFAGGHGGYFQAGKYAPSGRILVFDDQDVYGFGRKAQYLRWTTPLEHQLFSASKEAPIVADKDRRRGHDTAMIRFEKSPSLNPANKPLTVEAWVSAEKPNGVAVARGAGSHGYALVIRNGQPRFVVRVDGTVFSAAAKQRIVGRWTHLTGTLAADKTLSLYVDGKLAATAKSSSLITNDPAQAMQVGADDGGAVGDYSSPLPLTGLIDEVRVYDGALTADEVKRHHDKPEEIAAGDATPVLVCSFDDGDASDSSGNKNHGKMTAVTSAAGKVGRAMRFTGPRTNRTSGSLVQHRWSTDVPLLVRAMVLADKTLFVAGPPDVMDEEETFERLVARDPQVQAALAKQEAALDGHHGAVLHAVSTETGQSIREYKLESIPVWDGIAAAGGRLYLSTTDGSVLCLAGR